MLVKFGVLNTLNAFSAQLSKKHNQQICKIPDVRLSAFPLASSYSSTRLDLPPLVVRSAHSCANGRVLPPTPGLPIPCKLYNP